MTTTHALDTVWVADQAACYVLPTRAPASNPLDTVGAWWGLGLYQQGVLAWLVEQGGQPFVSDLVALRGFARDAIAVVDEQGAWSATPAGEVLYASRLGGDAA